MLDPSDRHFMILPYPPPPPLARDTNPPLVMGLGGSATSCFTTLEPSTVGAVSTAELALMKPTAFLVNTARGPIVDEGALLAALNNDGLAAAYLDVLAEEPPRKDSPGAALIAHDRCFVTPHTAWATDQSRRRLVDTACASIAAFLRGDELKYQV